MKMLHLAHFHRRGTEARPYAACSATAWRNTKRHAAGYQMAHHLWLAIRIAVPAVSIAAYGAAFISNARRLPAWLARTLRLRAAGRRRLAAAAGMKTAHAVAREATIGIRHYRRNAETGGNVDRGGEAASASNDIMAIICLILQCRLSQAGQILQ